MWTVNVGTLSSPHIQQLTSCCCGQILVAVAVNTLRLPFVTRPLLHRSASGPSSGHLRYSRAPVDLRLPDPFLTYRAFVSYT